MVFETVTRGTFRRQAWPPKSRLIHIQSTAHKLRQTLAGCLSSRACIYTLFLVSAGSRSFLEQSSKLTVTNSGASSLEFDFENQLLPNFYALYEPPTEICLQLQQR